QAAAGLYRLFQFGRAQRRQDRRLSGPLRPRRQGADGAAEEGRRGEPAQAEAQSRVQSGPGCGQVGREALSVRFRPTADISSAGSPPAVAEEVLGNVLASALELPS